jgi:hypothetical protein
LIGNGRRRITIQTLREYTAPGCDRKQHGDRGSEPKRLMRAFPELIHFSSRGASSTLFDPSIRRRQYKIVKVPLQRSAIADRFLSFIKRSVLLQLDPFASLKKILRSERIAGTIQKQFHG